MTETKRRLPLHTKIFIGLLIGLVTGIACQILVPEADKDGLKKISETWIQPVGQLFLRMIFMVVVPLLFSALVMGVAEIGEGKRIGRIGIRSLMMTILLSGLAVLLGLAMVNIFRPGDGISPEKRSELIASYSNDSAAKKNLETAEKEKDKTFAQAILEMVPSNPVVEANRALEGGLLPLMFFALVFGLAVALVGPEKTAGVRSFLEGLFAVSLKMIEFAMKLAPYGVAALIFYASAILGVEALMALGKYVLIVLSALAIHQFITYSIVLKLLTRRSPLQFFSQIREVMLTAFATSSSNATLPTALRVAVDEVKLPRDISSFVLTIGATANQNGTALFEGITVIFLAQLFGVDLTIAQQVGIMGLAILAGVGTAGVPGGAWPMIAVILGKFGVPPEAIGLVIGIDRILDMSRTVLNVTGDIAIATCVSDFEAKTLAKTTKQI